MSEKPASPQTGPISAEARSMTEEGGAIRAVLIEARKWLAGQPDRSECAYSGLHSLLEAIDAALYRPPQSAEGADVEAMRRELSAIGAALGTRFMDPPDGGDVPLSEQVRRAVALATEPQSPAPVDGEVERIISEDEVLRVHGNANFGAMTPREVVNDGVRKYAVGYTGGHTQLTILLEHGLITKPRPGRYDASLTKKGKRYARALGLGPPPSTITLDAYRALQARLQRAEGVSHRFERALRLALDYLGAFEPGDSRAVSNEYVAMLAVLCGVEPNAPGEDMRIIEAALAARQHIKGEG